MDKNDNPLLAGYRPRPEPPPKPAELLFEFLCGHDRFLCELRDHGHVYCVEAQFYQNEEFLIGRRFDPRLDATRPSREMAIQWAEAMRKELEQGADESGRRCDFNDPCQRDATRLRSGLR